MSPGNPPAAAAAAASAQNAAPPAPPAPMRPGNVPEAYWDAEKGALRTDDLLAAFTEASAAKAKLDERAALIPKDPAEYKLILGEDFVIPEGMTVNETDPRFAAFREAAHAEGLTQVQFDRLAKIQLSHEIKAAQATQAARAASLAAELKSLGPKGEERVNAVVQAIAGRVGEEGKGLVSKLETAADITAFEKLLNPGSNGGFSQTGREAADPTDIPGFETMTFRQRMAAIDQRKAGGR